MVESFANAFVRNKTELEDELTAFEENVKNFASSMSNKENFNIDDLRKTYEEQQKLKGTGKIYESSYNAEIFAMQNLIQSQKDFVTIQKEANKEVLDFAKLWVDMGGDFQTYLDMLPDYSKTLQSAMENALSVTDYEDRFNSIGEGIKQTLEKRMNEVSFAKLQQNFIDANDTMIALMSGSEVSMDNMMQLTQDMKSYTAQAEQSAYRTRAMLDMLSMDTNVDYSASNTQVEYQTGSTNNNTYNFNITNETTIGNFLGDNRAIQQFTDLTFGNIVESAKKFGYEIKKK